jgi:hypothetical protein
LFCAILTLPLVAALEIAWHADVSGFGESGLEQLVGWMALSVPYIVVLGLIAAVLVSVIVELLRPRRRTAILVSTLAGTLVLTALSIAPSTDWGSLILPTALSRLPLWLLFGATMRLPASIDRQPS